MKMSEQQQKIIDSKSNNIIVCAGAGSGKTRVLTERVRKILLEGANPKSVVVITFTNMAADELHQRLKDVEGSSKCFIGTIHSYANNILRKTGKQFEIFSEYYQTLFMERLIPKYARYCTMDDYMLFLKVDKQIASGRLSKSEAASKFTDYKVYSEILYLLGREYSSSYTETVSTLCKANNILTFDDLIKMSTEHFKQEGISLDYLFVDELQDIGYLEYNFLIALNAKHNFFIGDDYQAIFGFKGGDVNIFLSLMHNKDYEAFYLTENYRTAKMILMYANNMIKNADEIIKKDVICMNTNKGSLEFNSKKMLDDFLTNLKDNDDWFILTRSNKEMCQVEAILSKAKIKHYCFKKSDISKAQLDEIMSKPCIKVMTIHSSKGLECENVALYGKLPVKGTGKSDELKVYYVGLTRAKNKCVVFV